MIETSQSSDESRCNKSKYRGHTERMNVLQKCRTDSITHNLYNALLSHNNGKYTQALKLVQRVKEKIFAPYSTYRYDLNVDKYREAGGDYLPIETMMRRHIMRSIWIWNDQCIPELYIEKFNIASFKHITFQIPSLVCAFFLQYLCQRKLGCLQEADEALYELSLLVHHDDGHHIYHDNQATAWDMLGVCQQMRGDDRAALKSYTVTIRQKDGFYKKAACTRIGTMLVKYFPSSEARSDLLYSRTQDWVNQSEV